MMIKDVKEKLILFFNSPASLLGASFLIIISSTRLAYALVTSLALLWVAFFSTLIREKTKNFYPLIAGGILDISVNAFLGSLFFLLASLCSPFLAMELSLALILVPVYCFVSMRLKAPSSNPEKNKTCAAKLSAAISGTFPLVIFLILFSIVRELFGYGTLSLPGGASGIIELFSFDAFALPVRFISASAGAFLMLGYGIVVFRLLSRRAPKIKSAAVKKAGGEK